MPEVAVLFYFHLCGCTCYSKESDSVWCIFMGWTLKSLAWRKIFSLAWISSDWFMLVLLAGWIIRKTTIQMKLLFGGKRRVNVIMLIMLDPSAMETVFCTHFWVDRLTLDAEGNLHCEQLIAYNNKRDRRREVLHLAKTAADKYFHDGLIHWLFCWLLLFILSTMETWQQI